MKQNSGKTLKKVLSLVLSFVLIATTFMIFDPGTLKAAAAFSVWDGSYVTPPNTDLEQRYPGHFYKDDTNHIITVRTAYGMALYAKMLTDKGWCHEWTIKLDTDIDLNNKTWVGVGSGSKKFTGTFDGNGHVIKNMVTTGTDNDWGFFRAISGAIIKNVTFENCTVSTSSMSGEAHGVVVGWGSGSKMTFNNVTVRQSKVYGSFGIGGIIGKADSEIELVNCKNLYTSSYENTPCTGKDYFVKGGNGGSGDRGVGGLVGRVYQGNKVTLTNCTNSAYVAISGGNSYSYVIGGLVGYARGEAYVMNSNNYGVVGDSDNRKGLTGGLIGNTDGYVSISGSNNYGEVAGSDSTGGIIGWSGSNNNLVIDNCTNNGNVSGSGNDGRTGGFIGYSTTDRQVTITNSTNNGAVTGPWSVGGFIGKYEYNANIKIDKCRNNGNIECANNTVGGIIGHTNGSVTATNCMNTGNVRTTSTSLSQENTAGIVAYIDDDASTFQYCVNYGKVTGVKNVGGILGKMLKSSTVTFSYCGNLGEIAAVHASASDTHGAGILGWFGGSSTTLTSCFNGNGVRGNVGTSSNKFSRSAGLVGWAGTATIKYCYNNAPIVSSSYAGGLIAETSSASIQYSYNAGSVSGSTSTMYTGVLSGKVNPTSTTQSYYLSSASYSSNYKAQGTAIGESDLKGSAIINYISTTYWQTDSWPCNQGFPVLKIYDFPFEQTITFKNADGTTLSSKKWPYMSVPSYSGTPTKASDDNYQYTFKGWDKALTEVTADTTYTATYNSIAHRYVKTSISATQHNEKCQDCGYVKTNSAVAHTLVWKNDGTNHWQTCEACGYESAKTNHNSTLTWKSDATQHWQNCATCGYNSTKSNHSLGAYINDGDGGHHQHCSVCSYDTSTSNHALGSFINDGETGHHKDCASCDYVLSGTHNFGAIVNDGATGHHQACTDCGNVVSSDHTLGDYLIDGATGHYKKCAYCSYETSREDHVLVDKFDGTYHWQECEICHYVVNKVDHNLKIDFDGINHWIYCENCAYVSDVKTAHTLEYKSDGTQHWQECTGCNYATEKVAHTLTTQHNGDQHWQYCDICKYEGTKVNHSLTTQYDDANHWSYCSCGYTIDVTPHTHTLETYSYYHQDECECGHYINRTSHTLTMMHDAEAHWYVSTDGCRYEGTHYRHAATANMKFNSEQHYWYCKDCKYSYGYADHDLHIKPNGHDEKQHKYICSNSSCQIEISEDHVFTDASGKCAKCEYIKGDIANYAPVYEALDKVPPQSEIDTFFVKDGNYTHLEETIAAIKWDHTSGEQSDVNALATAIENAINGLTIKTYPVNLPSGCSRSAYVPINGTNHYMAVTISAPATNSSGQKFAYWVDENGNVASTYRKYTFVSCTERTFTPVYGEVPESAYIATKVLNVRDNLDGTYSILVEHSASSKVDINQHGVLFTFDSSKQGSLVYKTEEIGVNDAAAGMTASTKTGLFEVTIKDPAGDTIYLKSYVLQDGSETPVYSNPVSFSLSASSNSVSSFTVDEVGVASTGDSVAQEEVPATPIIPPMPDFFEVVFLFVLGILKRIASFLPF